MGRGEGGGIEDSMLVNLFVKEEGGGGGEEGGEGGDEGDRRRVVERERRLDALVLAIFVSNSIWYLFFLIGVNLLIKSPKEARDFITRMGR